MCEKQHFHIARLDSEAQLGEPGKAQPVCQFESALSEYIRHTSQHAQQSRRDEPKSRLRALVCCKWHKRIHLQSSGSVSCLSHLEESIGSTTRHSGTSSPEREHLLNASGKKPARASRGCIRGVASVLLDRRVCERTGTRRTRAAPIARARWTVGGASQTWGFGVDASSPSNRHGVRLFARKTASRWWPLSRSPPPRTRWR